MTSPLAKRIGNSPMARKVVAVSPGMKGKGRRELVVPAAPTKRGTRSRVAVNSSTRSTRTATARTVGARATKAVAMANPVTPKVKSSKLALISWDIVY